MSSPAAGAPRPRILVHGLGPTEIEAVETLAGSIVVVDDLQGVHPEEHDVIILTGAGFSDLSGVYPRRLVFARKPDPRQRGVIGGSSGLFGSNPQAVTRVQTQQNPARDFTVPDSVKAMGLESLVRRSCQPSSGEAYVGFRTPVHPERETVALLEEQLRHGLTLAAIFASRQESYFSESVIWLPDQARGQIREWLKVAIALWREDEPDRFPLGADWHTGDTWASLPEMNARRDLVAFEVEETRRLEEANIQRAALTEQLEQHQSQGSVWRSLLTETGDALVEAVRDAFGVLGFDVVDADSLPEHRGKNLRVTDGDWTALVEVKGYAKSAKSGDLLQLTSTVGAYAATTGRAPDALWYVPNIERDLPPEQRSTALDSREDDLQDFADAHNGSLIDTRELFSLRQKVALGQLSQVEARDALKVAAARFRA
jgi:hypothetical protein